MRIKYRVGDVTEAAEDYIIHGCNARGVMGSGVAAVIREKFPLAYENYRYIYETEGLVLGKIYPIHCQPKIIINAITQDFFGRSGARFVDYVAVRSCFSIMEEKYPNITLAMPRIGAGLGGGDWKVISNIIEEECKTIQPIVYDYEG